MLADSMRALRSSVGLSVRDHVVCLRIAGDAAFDTLDAVCPRELFVRDGRGIHTLLLAEDARILADLVIAREDEEFLIFAEGMAAGALIAHLEAHRRGADLVITDLSETHALLGVDGPFAWELLGEIAGAGVAGAPYLSLFRGDGFLGLRAGKTGEYGYDLLVAREGLTGWQERLNQIGRAYDAAAVGLDALDQCALENWFFNVRGEGRADATPIELQLQWRVSFLKASFVGAAALRERKRTGPVTRLVCLTGAGMAFGDAVRRGEREIGRIVNAGSEGSSHALALLDVAWAHPGLDGFLVGPAQRAARTVAPPVVDNRSLAINPQRHTYATDGRS